MNQILDYNPGKSSGGGSSGSDKIVRVFAILLIIFALCLLGAGTYQLMTNKKTTKTSTSGTDEKSKAKITFDVGDTTVTINVEHDKVIERLVYSWDSDKENTVKGKGQSTMETEISLLAGEHTLTVKVIDEDGNETGYEETIVSETGEDKIYPEIKIDIPINQIEVKVTDETEIAYVTYRWNDGDEVKITERSEDKKTIEFPIEIPAGKNDLMIVAVDASNNTTTEQKSFTGVYKPDVTIQIAADKKTATVVCGHDNGLKSIIFTINGEETTMNLEDKPTEQSYTIELQQQTTELKVKAISVDETETEAQETIVQSEDGSNDTEITIEKQDKLASINIHSIVGLKKVKVNINDVDYDEYISVEEGQKDFAFQIQLQEGNNRIKIVAIDINDNEKEMTEELALEN